MGIAKLYGQNRSGGKINGIIEDYYAYAGENISAGDFVEFINGVAEKIDYGTSVDTLISGDSCEGEAISATKLDDTRVFIAHGSGSSGSLYLYGIVCSIKGSEIIIGTDTWLIPEMYSGDRVSAVTLDENRVFIAHCYGNNRFLYGMVCKISGTTIETIGTDTKIREYSSAGSTISAMLLDTDKIFIGHGLNTTKLYGIICSVSNTTIAIGTDTQLSSANGTNTAIAPIKLSIDKIFIAHSQANDYLYSMICTVSGTTLTAVSPTALSNTSQAGSRISPELLPNGNIFIAHSYAYNSSYSLYGMVVIVNGTTINAGTDVQLDSSNYSGYTISTELLPSGKVFIAHSYGNDENYLYGMVATINGTTITAKKDTQLNNTANTGYAISSVLLDNGTIFLAHSYPYNSSNYWLYAQMFGIDETNNIPTNNVTITEYETQVRKATTPDIYGVAKTSGMGAYKVVEYTIPEGESVSKNEWVNSFEGIVEGNIIPSVWTEQSTTQYTAKDGTILTASSTYATSTIPPYAFDGISWKWESTSGKYYPWIKLKFPEARKIINMKTHCTFSATYGELNGIKIQGSNDDSVWTDLYTIEEAQTELTEIELSNTDFYKFYRIYFDHTNTVMASVHEWQVSKYVALSPQSGTALQSGTSGDTIQIAVPLTDGESTGHKDIVSIYTVEVEEPDEPVEPTYTYADFTSNVVPTTWTGSSDGLSATTSNDYGEWKVEVLSVEDSSSTPVIKAVDGSTSTTYRTGDYCTNTIPDYFVVLPPQGVSIKPTKISMYYQYMGSTSKIEGYNGSSWVDLGAKFTYSTSAKETVFSVSSNEYYERIRVVIYKNTSSTPNPKIYDFKITSGTLRIQN